LANPPEARSGATAVWASDRVILWGGVGTNGLLNSGAQLLFTNGVPSQWVALNLSNAPAGRLSHTAIWTGQKMIVWGGLASTPLADGAAYDPVANSWTTLASSNAPAARFNHAALWTGSEMLVLGGSGASGELATGAAYDPATNQWRVLNNGGSPAARAQFVAIWTGAEAMVFGGQNGGRALGALQRLTPQPACYVYRKQ